MTDEKYQLYLFRLCITFKVIEDEWINKKDENTKRIIKKLKIHDIYLQDVEQVKKMLDIINENNLIDNYDEEQIQLLKNI